MFGRKKVGIALSGGAARGLAHIGVLKVLEEIGVPLKAIAGTSMGAVVGAFYCSGINVAEMERYVKSMDWKSFLLFSDLALSNTGIINGRRVEGVLKKFLGDKECRECNIDFCCTAVDLITRQKVVLNEGKLVDAVRASISIPGFFAPVFIGNMMLVDGGVIEPLPTVAIKDLDVNFTIASSIIFNRNVEKYHMALHDNGIQVNERKERSKEHGKDEISDSAMIGSSSFGPSGTDAGTGTEIRNKLLAFRRIGLSKNIDDKKISVNTVLDTSLNIMHDTMVKEYAKKADILIEPEVGDFGFFDFTQGAKIIERGVEAATKKIPEIKMKLRIR